MTTTEGKDPGVVRVALPAIGRTGTYRLPTDVGPIEPGDLVVVEGPRGTTLGEARSLPTSANVSSGGTIRRVLRRATSNDLERQRSAEAREDEAFRSALQLLRTTGLDGRLIAVHADGISETMSVCIASEVRQDVKKFAQDLGRKLGMRTQVRQVSRREASARLTGVGRCGRALCCSTFLTDIPPTNIRTAKDQYMSLAPESVQGQCGGTLCCLAYEHADYTERAEWLPKMGKKTRTTTGLEGRVVGINALQMTFVLIDERRHRHVLAATEWEGNRGKVVPAPDARPPATQGGCRPPGQTSPQRLGLAESAAPEENST